MKRFTVLLLVLGLFTPVVVTAADFEGVVKMSMTGSREKAMPMTFSIKPGFTRIDMEAGQGKFGGMIMDQAKHEMTIILPEQSMYMVQPIPQMAVDEAHRRIDEASIEKSSEHEKILGYDTTKYIAKTKDGTSQIWITDQLGTFMGLGAGGPPGGGHHGAAPKGQGWEDLFKGKEAFPLRVVTTDSSGKQSFKMEATDIQKKSLPDSLFQPPPGFQKFDMAGMMHGMGMPGMPGMPPVKSGSGDE